MSRLFPFLQTWARTFWRSWISRASVAVLISALIFSLGIEVGSGHIQVSSFAARTQNTGLPAALDYSSVDDVYNALKINYDGNLTTQQLLDGLKEGLAQATNDPYTEYFNAAQAKQFSDDLNHSFSGIGAVLGKNSSGDIIVVSPIKGFPAEKAGLLPQDIITGINGEATTSMSPDVAASKIRGPEGTEVKLQIIRGNKTLSFTITRADIHLPSVTTKTLAGNIGYIQISSFADDTSQLVMDAANSFAAKHVKGIILDLRGNPGGLLDAAVNVSSLWLPSGKTIVSEKGTNGEQAYSSHGKHPLQGVRTVVLLDGGTASASEITAGALRDNNAAYLIGTKSFGKGVVQQLVQFDDGSELKVTIASWYRPDGKNINKIGITPDQTVSMSAADQQAHRDTQLQAAESYLQR